MFRLVQVKGDDAASFLQGQLTQDLGKVDEASALLAAWCNPKGRVICVLRALLLDGGFGLALPAELAELVVKRLLLYRLRAKVDIAVTEDWQAMAFAPGPDVDLLTDDARGVVTLEPGDPARCIELYGPREAVAALDLPAPLTDAQWKKALIAVGIPTVTTATTEQYTPHMLNLDLLDAVSFHKGCYTGQEIVARTEHRGQTRRRLLHYRLEHGEANVGDRLIHDNREVGEVLNTAGPDFLAVAPTDLYEQPLTVNGHPATPIPLPYRVSTPQ